jgi:Zn-dependent protease
MSGMGNPLLIAVIIGWIMSVCVHEYCHALAAYLAGDRSVSARGYLSMNPLLYLDPVMSVLIPLLALYFGGIPLPGGAVQIDRLALRKRWYASLVSAAGPASNFMLFLVCAAVIHPKVGLVDWLEPVGDWPVWAVFAGTMAVLQVFALLLNLLPIPPLDGFYIIEPYLTASSRERLMSPGAAMVGLAFVFFGFELIPGLMNGFVRAIAAVFGFVGIPAGEALECYFITFS